MTDNFSGLITPVVSSSLMYSNVGKPFYSPMGNLIATNQTTNIFSGSAFTPYSIFRGLVGSTYVYSTGAPPGGGAINIVIFKP